MPILAVTYGKDNTNVLDITIEVVRQFVTDDILTIPATTNINSIKFDPYPNEVKILYITYSIDNIGYIQSFPENRFCDIVINTNMNQRSIVNFNNIIIYPHAVYHNEDDGGLNVLYYLGKLLDEKGKNVRIYPTYGYFQNNIYNKYFVNDFDPTKAVVVYCEGTSGNPLNSNYVIRWMLSELGKNVNIDRVLSFGKKELVYYFLYELKMNKNPELEGNVYKCLSLIYLNPIFRNIGLPRDKGWCFTNRKSFYHKTIQRIHPENSLEIFRHTSCNQYLEIFNQYEYFVSYDPYTFLSIISAFCGCISIIYPVEGMTKEDWLSTTAAKEYMRYKNIKTLYGVAYGIEEIEWAKNTLHMALDQWKDMIEYYKEIHFIPFIEDIEKMDSGLENTVENNYREYFV
jgi:hypothetical protein